MSDFKHGTMGGYTNHACRCDRCRIAANHKVNEFRSRVVRTLQPDDPRHGTINAYTNYGCRCDRCREACRIQGVSWRANRTRK